MVIPYVSDWTGFYVLPKLHKPTLTFHPIVSKVATASYKLARFLSQSLAHLGIAITFEPWKTLMYSISGQT